MTTQQTTPQHIHTCTQMHGTGTQWHVLIIIHEMGEVMSNTSHVQDISLESESQYYDVSWLSCRWRWFCGHKLRHCVFFMAFFAAVFTDAILMVHPFWSAARLQLLQSVWRTKLTNEFRGCGVNSLQLKCGFSVSLRVHLYSFHSNILK